jgi:hypothetical protein
MRQPRRLTRALFVMAMSGFMLAVGVAVASASRATEPMSPNHLVLATPTVGSTPTEMPPSTIPTPTEMPPSTTLAPPETSPSTAPTPPPTPTETSPSGDPTTCADCACELAFPEPTQTTTISDVAYRPRAARAAPAQNVVITYTVKTNAAKNVANFNPATDVKVADDYWRDYVTTETAADDPQGCYKISFESRRFATCNQVTVSASTATGAVAADAIVLEPVVVTEPDGSKFTRFFYSFGKKRADTTFTIKVTCVTK